MKFRNKPVVIEAIQVNNNSDEVEDFLGECVGTTEYWLGETVAGDLYIEIKTLEGTMKADHYDWIIRGIKGEFYPCKPDIFEATYEKVG